MASGHPKKPRAPSPIKPAEEEDEESDEGNENSLKKQFEIFVKFKNEKDPGTHILLSQSDFWMKHAGVIKGRHLTTTDTGICYFKFKKYKLNFNEYMEFLQALADYKNVSVEEIIEKMIACGPPSAQEANVNPALQRR